MFNIIFTVKFNMVANDQSNTDRKTSSLENIKLDTIANFNASVQSDQTNDSFSQVINVLHYQIYCLHIETYFFREEIKEKKLLRLLMKSKPSIKHKSESDNSPTHSNNHHSTKNEVFH